MRRVARGGAGGDAREKVQKRLWGPGFQTWHLPTPRAPRTPPGAAGSGINPLPGRPASTHAGFPPVTSSATNCIYFLIANALPSPQRCRPEGGEGRAGGGGPGGAGAAVGGSRLSPAAGGGGGRARRGQHGRRGGSRTQGNPTQRPLLAEAGFWGPHRNPTSPPTPMSGLPPAPSPALRRRLPRGGEGRRPAPSRRAGLPPGSAASGGAARGGGGRPGRGKLRVGSGAGPGLRGASPGEGSLRGGPPSGAKPAGPGHRPAPAVAAPAPARRRRAHE